MSPAEPDPDRPAPAGVSEATVVVMTVAAWAAATLARPLPAGVAVTVAAGSAAAIGRGGRARAAGLVIAAALAASGLAVRADRAFVPVTPGPFDGLVTVLDDPRPDGPVATSLTVRLADDRRVRLVAHGATQGELSR
ncbi:MAG: hypothetical protein ACK5PP_20010, partial [Acidimicrobiales bacterium]